MNQSISSSVTRLFFVMAALVFSSLSLQARVHPSHSPMKWTHLGTTVANSRVDRDEIRVGLGEGTFDYLKIRVDGAALEVHKVTVYFSNGQTRELPVRQVIRAGSETLPIKLGLRERGIRKIVFWYETIRDGRRARVSVWAR